MAFEDDDVFMRVADEITEERKFCIDLAWSGESRPADPMVTLAAERRLPPGHVAFLGRQGLPRFKPDM